ncbi:hypothetical protein TanjilG_07621 [Lupinus angustifolius]|uniref:Exocyst complex subunit EXOC6/Sec15 C-terminal domain-containing protein n=1 Tax=Lupinus angustifolius TaxID=3871 RepID=A0A1J7FLM3_LUPAN|nr:hypothetical protein TanjilG_07621 [Lupinus angustifolius]
MEFGRWICSYVENNEIDMDLTLNNAMLDMYVKCGLNFPMTDTHAKLGNSDEAHLILDAMPHKETATWTALSSTYEQNGRTKKDLSQFHEMLHNKNAKPDEVTLVCTFCDCAPLGAIDFGCWIRFILNSENGNDYIHKVIIYLDSIMSTVQQISPSDGMYKVGSGAFDHISNSVVAAFSSHSVKRFNAKAVKTVDDHDLWILENFAEERFYSYGFGEIYNGGNSGSLVSKNAKQSTGKKSVDVLKKQLKEIK